MRIALTTMDDVEFRAKRGTVFIAEDSSGIFFGYWEQSPDGPPAMLEEGPDWESPVDAIHWGRARAERVLIRFADNREYWWASESAPPADSDLEGTITVDDDGRLHRNA